MTTKPLVSVVMSVYNGEKYLRESVDSILNQTFHDFELFVIDDGSSDNTKKIIESYSDERIIFTSRPNKGLVASLNEGIERARGKYIARQDADDISYPERLRLQVAYLEEHDDCVLVSSSYDILDSESKAGNRVVLLCRDQDIRLDSIVRNPFSHGAAMYRKNKVIELGAYNKDNFLVEDYALFADLASIGRVANLPSVQYGWRDNPKSVSSTNDLKQREMAQELSENMAEAYIPAFGLLGLSWQIVSARFYYKKVQGEIRKSLLDQFFVTTYNFCGILRKRGNVLLAANATIVSSLVYPRFAVWMLKTTGKRSKEARR